MSKTYSEINEKIKNGEVVVVTAEEMIGIVDEKGTAKAAQEVDVVTTGTFSSMCSSGAFLNFGHAKPRIRYQKAWLNNVNAYAGLAAVDLYIGATELPEDDPLQRKPDIELASEKLNWHPRTELEDGLKQTIKSFKTLH